MKDSFLHGVLSMPPELWRDDELDRRHRYNRYLQASNRIETYAGEIARLRAALRVCARRFRREFDEIAPADDELERAYATCMELLSHDAVGGRSVARSS
ncbi:MAG TPA: hypothetical protein VMC81_10230 [Rhodocyclaceae bacterium]|nr:hypothetical protein [Rhodocyclaceae bacterium]